MLLPVCVIETAEPNKNLQTCLKLYKCRLLSGDDGSWGLLGAGCRGSLIALQLS